MTRQHDRHTAPQLERDALDVLLVGIAHNLIADLCRACEGHLVDQMVLRQRFARGWAARHHIHDTGGNACVMRQ